MKNEGSCGTQGQASLPKGVIPGWLFMNHLYRFSAPMCLLRAIIENYGFVFAPRKDISCIFAGAFVMIKVPRSGITLL